MAITHNTEGESNKGIIIVGVVLLALTIFAIKSIRKK
jgi:hypothetical protein